MKAGVLFTGTGPILILTTYDALDTPVLAEKLAAKGIKKYIAYEVPVELTEQKYGPHFASVINDLNQEDDLRVLDYDGHHVFYNFSLADLGQPVYHESAA